MVVKAEVKYKVIFQSKYEGHSQIEVKHVLSTGIWFFCFSFVLFFLKFLLLRFVWNDVRGSSRSDRKMEMLQIYLP